MENSLFFLDTKTKSNIPEWSYFVDEVNKIFRLTKKEKYWLSNCNTAKLIVEIPFAAGCFNPERTAISHLCIYIIEIKGFHKYFDHTPDDDYSIFQRLKLISNFESGNKTIIKHGMNILALKMIEGYHNSQFKDKILNHYNPLNTHQWNYIVIKNKLLKDINNYKNESLDFYITNSERGWSW